MTNYELIGCTVENANGVTFQVIDAGWAESAQGPILIVELKPDGDEDYGTAGIDITTFLANFKLVA